MTIEIAIACIASVFSATALIAIFHERRCDVLHGRYIEGRFARRPFGRVMDTIERAIPFSDLREFVALLGWKVVREERRAQTGTG
jgi:hypothetical protein